MKYRKLRIAFSVACGILCLLLIVLWVRSYWWYDLAYCPLNSTPRMLNIRSRHGTITISAYVRRNDRTGWFHTGWGADSTASKHFVRPWRVSAPSYGLDEYGGYLRFPHWFPLSVIAAFGSVAALPWIRWRFSLRTLLIATTVVAVTLGLIIVISR